jgi:hypothetical protein
MKIYAIMPDHVNEIIAIHDWPVGALSQAGVIIEKQENFFSSTISKIDHNDLVIFWIGTRDESKLDKFAKLNCRKVIRNIDASKSNGVLFERELEIYQRLGLECLLVTYCTDYNLQFLAERGVKAIKYPHLFNFQNFGISEPKKQTDIFISGHLCEKSYPLRNKLANFFIKRKDKYKITYLPHPGYTLNNISHNIHGQDYINLASRSHISIICSGKNSDSLFVKYLEFAAALTLPIGDAPSNMPEDAKNQMILVSRDMSDSDIENLVDQALKDKENLKRRTLQYRKTMENNFDISRTAEVIQRLIDRRYDN